MQTSLIKLIYTQGYSLATLSDALNIPEDTIVDWCAGLCVPSTGQAISLAETLGCDLAYVYLAILQSCPRG